MPAICRRPQPAAPAAPLALLVALLMLPALAAAQAEERVWGAVTTTEGVRHAGYLRWEGGAAARGDRLTGRTVADEGWINRWMEAMGATAAPRGRSVDFLGVRISWDDDRGPAAQRRAAIALDDLRAITRGEGGGDGVVAHLSDGDSLSFPDGFGAVEVEGARGRVVRIAAVDQRRIDLAQGPPEVAPPRRRVVAEVEDRWGGRWRGPLLWSGGQSLEGDSLRGRERGFEIDEVAVVERRFEGGAVVTTRGGERWTVAGHPDVEGAARGLQVVDAAVGVVTIPWVDVRAVRFAPGAGEGAGGADRAEAASGASGAGPLLGRVHTRGGETVAGRIRWGEVPVEGWAHLGGRWRTLRIDVALRAVERIERVSGRSARLHLRGGGAVELRDGDFTGAGGAIVVEDATGALHPFRWRSIDSVVLDPPAAEPGAGDGR